MEFCHAGVCARACVCRYFTIFLLSFVFNITCFALEFPVGATGEREFCSGSVDNNQHFIWNKTQRTERTQRWSQATIETLCNLLCSFHFVSF